MLITSCKKYIFLILFLHKWNLCSFAVFFVFPFDVNLLLKDYMNIEIEYV